MLGSRLRWLLRAAGFGLALAVPVAVLAYLVRSEFTPLVTMDARAVGAATDAVRERPALYRGLLVWQELSNARLVNVAVSLVCLWVWRRRGLTGRALWAFGTLMAAWGLGLAVKFLVQRARPVVEDALARPPGYSFPSGHATNIMAAGLILVLLLWPLLGAGGRAVLTTAVGTVVVITGLDRVALGAHYPSDVVAGFALGASMAGASYLGYKHRRRAGGTTPLPDPGARP